MFIDSYYVFVIFIELIPTFLFFCRFISYCNGQDSFGSGFHSHKRFFFEGLYEINSTCLIFGCWFYTLFTKLLPFFLLGGAYGCLQNWEQQQSCNQQLSSIKKHKITSFFPTKWCDKKNSTYFLYKLPHVNPRLKSPSQHGQNMVGVPKRIVSLNIQWTLSFINVVEI